MIGALLQGEAAVLLTLGLYRQRLTAAANNSLKADGFAAA
jgi:hypothetical protein